MHTNFISMNKYLIIQIFRNININKYNIDKHEFKIF